jgi:hypothetical protein
MANSEKLNHEGREGKSKKHFLCGVVEMAWIYWHFGS